MLPLSSLIQKGPPPGSPSFLTIPQTRMGRSSFSIKYSIWYLKEYFSNSVLILTFILLIKNSPISISFSSETTPESNILR